MHTSRYFYRDFYTNKIQELTDIKDIKSEKFHFIENSRLSPTLKTICPQCNTNQLITSINTYTADLECGHSIKGHFVEYPTIYVNPDSFFECKPHGEFPYILSESLNKMTPENLSACIKYRINLRKYDVENKFAFTEDNVPKKQFLYQINTDLENLKLEIIWFSNIKNEIQSKSITYDFKETNIYGDKESIGDISNEIAELAFLEYGKIISKWAGFPVTVNVKGSIGSTLSNLTAYPFCPNINKIIYDPIILHYKGKCDRTNPECYKQLCKSLKLDDCKTIRKLFAESPETLLGYKVLKESGFKDINIIAKILQSNILCQIINQNYSDYIFYLRKTLKHNNEKKVFNYLLSNFEDDFYNISDGVTMFHLYYRKLEKSLKKAIIKDGFTELTHNTLASVSEKYGRRNVRFKYTPEQKKFEDKIGDYHFYLPQNSNKLIELGVSLHNCVASYTQKIVNKECTVVYATLNNNYEICIEIRDNEIHQKRGKFNQDLTGKAAEVMELYQQRHKLIFTQNQF